MVIRPVAALADSSGASRPDTSTLSVTTSLAALVFWMPAKVPEITSLSLTDTVVGSALPAGTATISTRMPGWSMPAGYCPGRTPIGTSTCPSAGPGALVTESAVTSWPLRSATAAYLPTTSDRRWAATGLRVESVAMLATVRSLALIFWYSGTDLATASTSTRWFWVCRAKTPPSALTATRATPRANSAGLRRRRGGATIGSGVNPPVGIACPAGVCIAVNCPSIFLAVSFLRVVPAVRVVRGVRWCGWRLAVDRLYLDDLDGRRQGRGPVDRDDAADRAAVEIPVHVPVRVHGDRVVPRRGVRVATVRRRRHLVRVAGPRLAGAGTVHAAAVPGVPSHRRRMGHGVHVQTGYLGVGLERAVGVQVRVVAGPQPGGDAHHLLPVRRRRRVDLGGTESHRVD